MTALIRDGVLAILVASVVAMATIAGCTLPQAQSDQVTTVLTELTNKAINDLKTAKALALAATPPDTDGAACFDAGTAVATAMQQLAAAQKGMQVGALSAAEFGTLVQPGSAQFNWAVKTLETGCIAKIHDVNQAINSTAGIFVALPGILGLAGAPVGM